MEKNLQAESMQQIMLKQQHTMFALPNGLMSVAVRKKITIYQKYLVRGHTQMECDAMHATIERRLAKSTVNVPADYAALFRSARIHPAPYTMLNTLNTRSSSTMNSCSTTEQSGQAVIQIVHWSLTSLCCATSLTVFSTSFALMMIGCHCQLDAPAGRQVRSLIQLKSHHSTHRVFPSEQRSLFIYSS